MAYSFRFGEAKACCDRCGFDFRLPQLRKEWTGLMVCSDCWEPRHPQDFVRGVPDRQSVPNARPEPDPVFVNPSGWLLFDGIWSDSGTWMDIEASWED